VPPQGQGVWAPFFGQPAYTVTLAGRLVQQTGAVPAFLWSERLPGGRGWRIHTTLGVDLSPPADSADAAVWTATRVNAELEAMIRQGAEQYLWGYHRYKEPATAASPPAPEAPGTAP